MKPIQNDCIDINWFDMLCIKNEAPKFCAKISLEVVLRESIKCQTFILHSQVGNGPKLGTKSFLPKCKCVVVSMISRKGLGNIFTLLNHILL